MVLYICIYTMANGVFLSRDKLAKHVACLKVTGAG